MTGRHSSDRDDFVDVPDYEGDESETADDDYLSWRSLLACKGENTGNPD